MLQVILAIKQTSVAGVGQYLQIQSVLLSSSSSTERGNQLLKYDGTIAAIHLLEKRLFIISVQCNTSEVYFVVWAPLFSACFR